MGREDYTPYDLAVVLFCDYINAILDIPVIIERSNTPQNVDAYASVFLSDNEQVVHDVVLFDKVTDEETVRGLGLLRFVVQTYGKASMGNLVKLQQSFETSHFIFGMEVFGFGLSEKGSILNTTAPFIDARFEERAELKCSFYHTASNSFAAAYFDKELITIERDNYSTTFDGEKPPRQPGDICESN